MSLPEGTGTGKVRREQIGKVEFPGQKLAHAAGATDRPGEGQKTGPDIKGVGGGCLHWIRPLEVKPDRLPVPMGRWRG